MVNYFFRADKPIEEYRKSDPSFIALVVLMCGMGVFALFICSQNYAEKMFDNTFYFVRRQLISIVIGFVGFILFASLSIERIRKILPAFVIGTVILCLLTFVPGISIERNGAHRWIRMPLSFTFQPSELAKFATVLFLANLFDKQERIENPEEKSVLSAVFGLIVISLIIFFQKDFSTAIFIFAIGIILFFSSNAKMAWLWPMLILIIPAIILMILTEPFRLERIIGFVKPDEHLITINYQSIAAKRAISSGGFWGSGIGSGLVWINSIPEVQADYIFAGWVEAMGFFGVAIYFLMLGAFSLRGYYICVNCKNRFAAYTSFGCITIILLQSIMNCAVVCGAIPVTGIPLPFFSSGGSSIIVTLTMCGFVVNASRRIYSEEEDESVIYEGEI